MLSAQLPLQGHSAGAHSVRRRDCMAQEHQGHATFPASTELYRDVELYPAARPWVLGKA